jgi:hypothetical protein
MDAIKVLGQSAPSATTPTDLYSVPDYANDSVSGQSTCSSLVICNRGATATTFRVSVSVAEAATANKDYLFYDTSIPGNSTVTAVLGITLGEKDIMRVYAGNGNLSFTLFGVETT